MNHNLIKLEDVAWDLVPKVEDERFIPIYSPKPRVPCYLWCVCDRAITVGTHYLYRRTVPCVGIEKGCEGCELRRSLRVKTYIGAWEPQFSRLVMAELTTEAVKRCEVDLLNPKVPLRGWWLKSYRIGDEVNSAVRVEVSDKRTAPELPEPFDVRRALIRVWNGATRPK